MNADDRKLFERVIESNREINVTLSALIRKSDDLARALSNDLKAIHDRLETANEQRMQHNMMRREEHRDRSEWRDADNVVHQSMTSNHSSNIRRMVLLTAFRLGCDVGVLIGIGYLVLHLLGQA